MTVGKQIKQTQEQGFLEVIRALNKNRGEIPAKEFTAAAERVGLKERQRLEWAIRFSQQPVEGMSAGDGFNAQLEVGAFLHPYLGTAAGRREIESVPSVAALFPLGKDLGAFKKRFLGHIQLAADGAEFSFAISEMNVTVGPEGFSYGYPSYDLGNSAKLAKAQQEVATLNLAKLLAAHWGLVGRCERNKHGCGKLFLRSRSDQEFCSRTCVNRSNTNRRRGKEPVE